MKSITINAKEWFDKVNGNSYFSARIYIDGSQVGVLPFQYGYDSHYLDKANQWLDRHGYIDNPRHYHGSRTPLWSYCENHDIELHAHKQDKCLKRELDK